MKKKKLDCIVALEDAQRYVKPLEEEVEKLKEQYLGRLVCLKNSLGHKEDGFVNGISIEFVSHSKRFGEKYRICIVWNLSPLRKSSGGAFVSSHSFNFYNATEIELVDDWKKISNIFD